jgi:hypothetical protein
MDLQEVGRMKTIYIVLESSWRGKFVSAVFSNEAEAKAYMYELRGEDYSFDSAYEYYIQEWEVK